MCKRCIPLINALEDAKVFINLDGTNKPRKRKEDVLKIIRHALSPKSGQQISEDLTRYRQMEIALLELYNKYSRSIYWGMWKILGQDRYAEHKRELSEIIDTLNGEMQSVFKYLK